MWIGHCHHCMEGLKFLKENGWNYKRLILCKHKAGILLEICWRNITGEWKIGEMERYLFTLPPLNTLILPPTPTTPSPYFLIIPSNPTLPHTRGGRPTTSISSPNHILLIVSSEPPWNPRPFNIIFLSVRSLKINTFFKNMATLGHKTWLE